jgi:septum formation protein
MLLTKAGLKFRVVQSDVVEESGAGECAADFALRMAREKALAVSARFGDEVVLGADTVVECAGRILGKPSGEAEARAMLTMLSGRTHMVQTAFAIARAGAILESACVTSHVTFRTLSHAEIDDYLRTAEPFDKAGAYGIQGQGAGFVVAVEGSRDNVMGLPTAEVLAALQRHGISAPPTEPSTPR